MGKGGGSETSKQQQWKTHQQQIEKNAQRNK
jgi:hypothetical protein